MAMTQRTQKYVEGMKSLFQENEINISRERNSILSERSIVFVGNEMILRARNHYSRARNNIRRERNVFVGKIIRGERLKNLIVPVSSGAPFKSNVRSGGCQSEAC